MTSKLYAYVDESGRGSLPFTVAVVVVNTTRDTLADVCEQTERSTGKGRPRWQKSDYFKRLAYMRAIVNNPSFASALAFVTFHKVDDYDQATISTIARALAKADPFGAAKVTVYVDALSETKRREYSAKLKQIGASFVTVRSVRKDESNPLIRLADALAGFVQDAQGEQSEEVTRLFERARRGGVITAV